MSYNAIPTYDPVPDCMTAEFKSNYLSTERRCVSCMHCTTEQPEVPVRLRARWPGAAAVKQRIPLADEALIALIIWAVFPVDHVLGSDIVAQFPQVQALPGFLAASLPYITSIAATILAFALVNFVGARWSGLDARTSFTRFAFAYAPLGIMFQLGRHIVTGLMESGGALLNGFAAGLGIPLDLSVAWASADTIAAWSHFSATGWLWIAVLWGAAIAWFVARDLTETTRAALKACLPHVVLMSATMHLVIRHLA